METQSTELTAQDVWQMFAETSRQLQESQLAFENRQRESDRQFAEELVAPAVVRLMQERDIHITQIFQRVANRNPEVAMEIDILGVDKTYAVLVEVKSRLGKEDVDEHLARLAKFKTAFPLYQTYHVFGVVVGLEVPENIGRYADRKGLFVLAQSGEAVSLLNDAQFSPREW